MAKKKEENLEEVKKVAENVVENKKETTDKKK